MSAHFSNALAGYTARGRSDLYDRNPVLLDTKMKLSREDSKEEGAYAPLVNQETQTATRPEVASQPWAEFLKKFGLEAVSE